MRVLVTGSTTWRDRDRLAAVISEFPPDMVFVTGDTAGIDALVIDIGEALGYRVDAMRKTQGDARRYPRASWKGLNERMIATGVAQVLAFHPDLGKPGCARGTQHAIDLANAAGIAVQTYTS